MRISTLEWKPGWRILVITPKTDSPTKTGPQLLKGGWFFKREIGQGELTMANREGCRRSLCDKAQGSVSLTWRRLKQGSLAPGARRVCRWLINMLSLVLCQSYLNPKQNTQLKNITTNPVFCYLLKAHHRKLSCNPRQDGNIMFGSSKTNAITRCFTENVVPCHFLWVTIWDNTEQLELWIQNRILMVVTLTSPVIRCMAQFL